MQDAVERVLEGQFHNGSHSLEFSSPVIELSLREGEDYEGSFVITGPENQVTEGRVSSTRIKMRLLTEYFSGSGEEIAYRFDGSGMSEGDSLKGEFRIISNHGEYYIPYDIHILSGEMESELGTIKNLFHFTNLARSSWDEAVKLFYSKEFEHVFEGVDRQYYGAYRGLSGGSNREQNVEEFLLEVRKKQKVEFLLEESEIRVENVDERTENRLVINRSGWGYSELSVEREGDFIVLEKDVIREEDFLGNCYRLPFYISAKALHSGKNYGCIRLKNPYCELTASVTVNNQSVTVKLPGTARRKKHVLVELMQYYEAFRTKKISGASWMKETESLVEELISMDARDPVPKLYRAQLLITGDARQEARRLLEQVEGMMEEDFDPALYCYYLYLSTLLDEDEESVEEKRGQVERIFAQNSDNWRIAWLLLYLSGEYVRSPSKRWLVLEEQFRQGCKSPVLYIEAWNLIAANPALLMRLDDFELQVLSYGARKEILTADVILQIVYLSQKTKNYSGRLFAILKACYRTVPGDETLQALCALLIKGNITSEEAFSWYEKGIQRELRITRLYEYYMMSFPLREDKVIPKIVLMYFAFDSTLDSLHNSFLYAYVHKKRGEFPELYENYRQQIESFVTDQILKERSNPYLAYLYKNLFDSVVLTPEAARGFSVVLFMQRLVFERGDIRKVIVVYEKEKEEVIYPVSGKEACIPVYGGDCRVLLEDGRGNRFCRSEEFTQERLIVPEQFASRIAPYVEGCVHFDLWLCERGNTLSSVEEENVQYMKRLVESDQIRDEVRREIRIRLLQYLFDHDRMQEVDDFLEALEPDQIQNNCFSRIVRFMVLRGMHERAFEWIRLRGEEGVEAKVILRLCSRMIAIFGMEENGMMTELAFRAFKAGKYDGNLLEYLCRFFHGTSKEMRDLWKAAESFGVDTYHLSERILSQLLYTGAYVGERAEIFRRYVSGGARTEVELAVLAQCCWDYFVRGRAVDDFLIEDLQRVAERHEEVPFVCKLAYTRYYAENKKQVDERISRTLVAFLREILEKEKYFPYFKEYADNIVLMRRFQDKTMVEYRAESGNRVFIHYQVEREGSSGEEYVKEEMQDMFGGIFVKEFILFFGEHLQYYITETEDGKDQLTQSGTLSRTDAGGEQREDRYTLLNDIAIGRNLHDYDTMENLLREYFEKEFIVGELFHPI